MKSYVLYLGVGAVVLSLFICWPLITSIKKQQALLVKIQADLNSNIEHLNELKGLDKDQTKEIALYHQDFVFSLYKFFRLFDLRASAEVVSIGDCAWPGIREIKFKITVSELKDVGDCLRLLTEFGRLNGLYPIVFNTIVFNQSNLIAEGSIYGV